MEHDDRKVRDLAADIHCGTPLASDLLMLAGGDANLVREASNVCRGVDSLKAYIIDKRISKVE